MSSSSSLSAARRRRAGGGQQPVSNTPEPSRQQPRQQSNQQPPSRSSGNGPPPNPYMLLQQHHVKINELEKKINELSSGKNTEPMASTGSSDTINSQIDATKFSDMIINRIESQLDLKAFYENDTRLAGEMEDLNKIVQSQQLLINEMNSTLFHVIQQLNLHEPTSVESTDSADSPITPTRNITFETTDINFTGIDDDDTVSNYEGAMDNSMTFGVTGVNSNSNIVDANSNIVDASINIVDASNNV